MQITFNKHTALAIVRALRSKSAHARALSRRADIVPPDPSPRKRWSRRLFNAIDLGSSTNLGNTIDLGSSTNPGSSTNLGSSTNPGIQLDMGKLPIDIAIPDSALRLGAKGVSNTVYSDGIPSKSFIDLGNGIHASSPELLFVELAGSMNPIEHLMLGHELCGSFSRDPIDPYNGSITYGVQPATSVERIREFLHKARYIHNIDKAATSLKYLNDNAWSPTESLVTALLRLPVDSLGYDIGSLTLNPRVDATRDLPGAKGSRVPDITIDGTPVGINYDGLVHLDLDSIVKAALEVGQHPGYAQAQAALDRTLKSVRAKAVDDIHRNRELAAGGLFVMPVVKEDLYTVGGFDQIVELLIDAIEELTPRRMPEQRDILRKKALSRERHRAILSLLPGKSERGIQIGRFINGCEVVTGPQVVYECWIEL